MKNELYADGITRERCSHTIDFIEQLEEDEMSLDDRIELAHQIYWKKVMDVPSKYRQDPDGFDDRPYFEEAIKEAGLK